MTVGSLFSGVGGFDLGLERAGMRIAWQVEFDKQAQSVLRHRWPDVALYDDVRNVGGHNLEPVDLICGGFPCQDLSVAGRRAGLAGERSGLFYEFMRIVDELSPRWVLIENVPGLLSSNGGRDMGAVVGTLGELGYWWTYRVLDSQYFGVAQRRRRVFIVGHLGAPCPPEILLEPEGLPGHPAPGREARQGAAGGAAGGAGDESGYGGVAFPVTAREGKGPASSVDSGNIVMPTLRANTGRTYDGKEDPHNLVVHTLRAMSHAGSHANAGGQVAVAFAENSRAELRLEGGDGSRTGALSTGGGKPSQGVPMVAASAVRRLTPRECERLQAFPDNWTRYGIEADGRKVKLADGPRYRMMGNAITTTVAEWIGHRIIAHAHRTATRQEATATIQESLHVGGGRC